MKRFRVELRDLSSAYEWTYVNVYYECDQIYEIIDDFNHVIEIKKLSSFDKDRLEKRLIYELQADNT